MDLLGAEAGAQHGGAAGGSNAVTAFPLRRIAAVLFVVTAALFVIGVASEGNAHGHAQDLAEPTTHATGDADGNEARAAATGAAEREASERSGTGDAAGRDPPSADGVAPTPSREATDVDEEEILGFDVESTAALSVAVAASVALAVGLWLSGRTSLAVAAVVVGVAFAVFDVAEAVHQADEANTGLVLLATVVAIGHLGAAGGAASTVRAHP
jgi:hypothetical protein